MKKKYYDGFIVHDILDAHLKPGKMLEVLKAFAEVKGVDAVEVIRCKDCKYSKPIDSEWLECQHDKRCMKENGFCSWAERKPPQVNPEMVREMKERLEKYKND